MRVCYAMLSSRKALFPKPLQDFAGFTGLSRIHNSIANLGKGKGIIMNNHEYIFVASIIDFDDDLYKLFLEHDFYKSI